jgi:hypothetical protein
LRVKGRFSLPLQVDLDIRKDPRWNHGHLDRWAHNRRVPLMPSISPSSDPSELLEVWFRAARIALLQQASPQSDLLVTDDLYNDRHRCPADPHAVLIGFPPADLSLTAARYRATPAPDRPLLLHPYLPNAAPVDFVSLGLPRPVPILPLLIRRQVYVHQPGGPHPSTASLRDLLLETLGKNADPAPTGDPPFTSADPSSR